MGSVIIPLDRSLLSSYRLSIVTILLSVAVWLYSTQERCCPSAFGCYVDWATEGASGL